MSRFGVIWFILVIASGMTNFLVKQNVQGLDDQLSAVRKKTVAEQKAIHELTADWTFLNQPELLADLNNRYVHLAAVSPKQVITSLDSIPLRPTPAPAQIAEATVAPPPLTTPAPAQPKPVAVAMATPAASTPMPIVPVAAPAPVRRPAAALSVIATAHAAEPPAATQRPVPAAAKPAPSLNGLFAQVAGDQ